MFTRRFTPQLQALHGFQYYIDGDDTVRVCSADSYETAWEGIARLAGKREFILEFCPVERKKR